jgi:hypothetical protein
MFTLSFWKRTAVLGVLSLMPAMPAFALTVPAPTETEGKVSIRIAAMQNETLPGEDVTVTVEVWNQDKRTQNDLSVSLTVDGTGMDLPSALPLNGTFANPSTGVWTIDELFAGRTWRITLPVSVRDSVQHGTAMMVTARVSGDDINPDTSMLLAQTTIGTAVLPATGGRFDLLAIFVTTVTAAFAAAMVRRSAVR